MDFTSWRLEFHSGIPVYRQIIHRVQAAVGDGTFAPGDQLPTIRALCDQLGVNPNTVARAYRELESLGVIEARRGAGSFIAPQPKAAGTLSARDRDAKAREIAARVASEANSLRIPLDLVLCYLNQRHD